MSVALILPSRGLIHSRTAADLLDALSGYDLDDINFYWSHDNSIPECFNNPMLRAIENPNNDKFIIVEEDMQVPVDFIDKMEVLRLFDIAFYDYPMRQDGGKMKRVTQEYSGIVLSGTGLIGFTRKAAEQLFPLRSDMEFTLFPPMLMPAKDATKAYGQHDIYMWYKIHELGLKFTKVGNTGHYKLIEYGEQMTNKGCHEIELLT